MNKKAFTRSFLILVLILLVVGLYFYTEPTKQVIGMAASKWEPVSMDIKDGLSLNVSNLTEDNNHTNLTEEIAKNKTESTKITSMFGS